MAASDPTTDDSLYPIAVLIDELKNEDVQVIDTVTHDHEVCKPHRVPRKMFFLGVTLLIAKRELDSDFSPQKTRNSALRSAKLLKDNTYMS